MENSSLPTFYRQLRPRTVITLIAICSLFVWTSLWFDHDKQQLSYQVRIQLPSHKQALQHFQFQRAFSEQTNTIKSISQAGDLQQQHQHLLTMVQEWQSSIKLMRPVLESLNSFNDSVLTRIDFAAQENENIRQQALALVLDTQAQLIATRQDINLNEITPSHDVLLQYVNALLFDINIGLKELSLQTSDIRFEQLSSDINHLLTAYKGLVKIEALADLHVAYLAKHYTQLILSLAQSKLVGC